MKKGQIIIWTGTEATAAFVDADEQYYIQIDTEILGGHNRERDYIGPDHEWDNRWFWCYTPRP